MCLDARRQWKKHPAAKEQRLVPSPRVFCFGPLLYDLLASSGASSDASKAANVRAALERKVGKEQATQLLAQTQVAVVRHQGKNTRVLKADGSTLKLKQAPIHTA
jgi:hypothetical protein